MRFLRGWERDFQEYIFDKIVKKAEGEKNGKNNIRRGKRKED